MYTMWKDFCMSNQSLSTKRTYSGEKTYTCNVIKPLHISVIFRIIKDHTAKKPSKCSQCSKVLQVMVAV